MGKWLVKSDPDEYSLDHLMADGEAPWDGVRNALAQQHLRQMEAGDPVLIYHSGEEKAVVGLAQVAKEAYLDATDRQGKSACVDLKFVSKLKKPVPLCEVKANEKFKDLALVRISRLSVMPVKEAHWKQLMHMAGES